jgi:hypothetical protein
MRQKLLNIYYVLKFKYGKAEKQVCAYESWITARVEVRTGAKLDCGRKIFYLPYSLNPSMA